MNKPTKRKRETIIRRSAKDKCFDVWSDVPRDINRLRKSAAAFGCPVEESDSGVIYVRELPIRAITFRASSKRPIHNPVWLNTNRSRSETDKTGDMNDE